jgi:hypothetical protein
MNAPAIAQWRRATASVLAVAVAAAWAATIARSHHMAPMTDGLVAAGTHHRVCRVRPGVALMAIMIAVGVMDIPRRR